jgi:hypothetical protein
MNKIDSLTNNLLQEAIMNKNLFRLSYGVVAALTLGLSGCYFDGQSAQERDYTSYDSAPKAQVYGKSSGSSSGSASSAPKAAAKGTSSSSEPAQKTTPGPKRTAAPQLPVIQ